MRCVTLALEWRSAGFGPVGMFGSVTLDFVEERLRAADIPHSGPEEIPGGGVLVVDSYSRSVREERDSSGHRLRLLVDDTGEVVPSGFGAVWNPNAYGSPSQYPDFSGPVLTGPEAVPIRSGLPTWESGPADRAVAISLGGGLPSPPLRASMDRLAEIIGSRQVCGVGDWLPARWTRVDPRLMWETFANCAVLVTAAGTTVWEAAATGIPVVVIRTAENQSGVAEWASTHGVTTLDAEPGFESSLVDAVASAIPLPLLRSGAAGVARTLHRLAEGIES
jgi:hypothetical protein